MKMVSIWRSFGTLGSPKVRFFTFWVARARTFAHSARANAILSEFGGPRGVQKKVSGTAQHLWGLGKVALGTSGR